MAQDTRKDKRATLDSLVVRYKSATVDEFIENHSHDVSAGGLFVQTEAPFTAGTLLKFEIRIGDDQSVIVGVGRVVWKRDTVTPDGRPPGMGVKFIKIDDPSKTLIRNLVEKNTGAGVEYQAGLPAGAAGNVPGGVASPAAPEQTVLPAAAAPLEAQPAAAATAAAGPAAGAGPTSAKQAAVPAARSTFASRKSTMLGIGAVSAEAVAAATAEKAAGASEAAKKPERPQGLSFAVPASEGFQEHEPTVMKQAAELLAEALREAGGSMEEVGQNPLFSGAASKREATLAAAPAEAPVEVPTASTAPATEAELPATRRVADVLGETMLDSDAGPSASASVSSTAKTEPIEAVSAVDAPVNETKPMVVAPAAAAVAAAATDSSRPKREPFKTKVSAASPVVPAEPAPKDTTSRNMLVAAALVVLLGGGAFAAWKAGLMPGGEPTTEPTPAPMPSVVTILPPASVLAPLASVTASAEPATAASAPLDAGTAAADAATTAPVESAAAPVVAPKAPSKPYVPPKPKPKPVDPEEPGPKEPEGTSGGTEPSGGGGGSSTSGAVPAPTPTPSPTPKPVPEKPVEPELQ